MKTLSKHHIEAIEKANAELGNVNAAALAMVETPMDLIKAVLLKHKVAVFEVMCELHQQEQADEALLRQALDLIENMLVKHPDQITPRNALIVSIKKRLQLLLVDKER